MYWLPVFCIINDPELNGLKPQLFYCSQFCGIVIWAGLGRDMEKAMAPHSSTLAWKIPWRKEPGRLQSMGSLGVGHDWATSLSLFTFMHWRRKWQPTPAFLPGESQGREPGGLPSLGSHRAGHDWSNSAATAAGKDSLCMLDKVLDGQLNWSC